ncbi:MAG: hypothetical protein IPH20_06735 [Bacteroidales bacterium]|nr:hypothetical protein [Bacteroidales bacterium]
MHNIIRHFLLRRYLSGYSERNDPAAPDPIGRKYPGRGKDTIEANKEVRKKPEAGMCADVMYDVSKL